MTTESDNRLQTPAHLYALLGVLLGGAVIYFAPPVFLLFVLAALALATYGLVMYGSGPQGKWYFLGFLAALLQMGLVLLPEITSSSEAARRTQCRNQLKHIMLAMHAYEVKHGCFPPPYLADSQGRPMHSWRVLLLPHMDQVKLYRQYRFDEPWDGPHNRALQQSMYNVYHCPDDKASDMAMTSYVAVVGPNTAWNLKQPTNMETMGRADGTSSTIGVIEIKTSGIHWMEPRDLYVEQMAPTLNAQGQGPSSNHFGDRSVHAVFFDGSVHALPNNLTAEQLRALLSPQGRETIQAEWIR